nr:hypothetical protein [Alicyclobacillus tolerans]
MDRDVCGYCGHASEELLNRYGVHDYCLYESDEEGDMIGTSASDT